MDRREYAYAGSLLLGLAAVTPLGGLGLAQIGVPDNVGILATLGLCAGLWGTVVVWNGDFKRGLAIATLILTTFSAFVPLGLRPTGIAIAPRLYLIDPILLVFCAVTLSTWRRRYLTVAHGLLSCYVIWSILLVMIAPGPRLDIMAWYAVHVLRITLTFVLITRTVSERWLSPETSLGIVVLTVIGQGLVATAQLFTGPIETLNVLGVNTRVVASISAGPLGTIPTGPYVAGFTGGAPFVNQLILVIPVIAALLFTKRIPRIVTLGSIAWLAVLIQLTAWDAARGALLVGICLTAILFGWWWTDILEDRISSLTAVVYQSGLFQNRWTVCALAFIGTTLAQIVQFGRHASSTPTYLNPSLGQSVATSLVIPGFNTANLSVRLYQYVGGIDTFLKYPLTGLGGANFEFIAMEYVPVPNMIHNMYIGILAETGIVGAVLYFGSMLYGIRTIWYTARTRNGHIFVGLLAGIGGVLALQSLQPQYLFTTSMLPLWALLGIGVGTYCRDRSQRNDRWESAMQASASYRATGSARTVTFVAEILPNLHRAVSNSHGIGIIARVRSVLHRACVESQIVGPAKAAWEDSRLQALIESIRVAAERSRILR